MARLPTEFIDGYSNNISPGQDVHPGLLSKSHISTLLLKKLRAIGRLRKCILVALLLIGIEPNPGPGVGRLASVRCGFLNVQSAVHKSAVIHDTIQDFNLDVLSLNETWIVHDDPDAIKLDPAPEGFSILHVHRKNATKSNRGGGLAIIYRNHIRMKARSDVFDTVPTTFEFQLVDMLVGKNKSVLCNIYRPPNTSISRFLEELSDFLEVLIVHAGNKLILCGDFNCPGSGCCINDSLASLIECFDLDQHVHEPTRGVNLLDLIITVCDSEIINGLKVNDAGLISDHNLVTFYIPAPSSKPHTVQYSYRNIKNINIDVFVETIASSDLFTSPATTTDSYAEQLRSTVTGALDAAAPLITKKHSRGNKSNRWLSTEAKASKRERRRLEREWKKHGRESTRIIYRASCRRTQRLIMKSRKEFYKDRITSAENSGQQWGNIKNLLHTNNSHVARRPDEAASFCSTMVNFFRDKIVNLKSSMAAQLSGKVVNPFAWDKVHSGIPLDVLQPVTPDEVGTIIGSMSSKSSPLDFIPTSLLKSCVVVFAPAIANLANLSFSEGRFPGMFKTAQVTPLLKKQGIDIESPSSYRPISNLNSISKILEKLFASRLKSHIKYSTNINIFQSAYKQFNSTETALLKITNDILADFDKKKASILIALDLSAAFDTLDHSTVLQKIELFVRTNRNRIGLDQNLSGGQITVCQDRLGCL